MVVKKKASLKSKMSRVRAHFQKTSGGNGSDITWFKIPEGRHGEPGKAIIRVLPAKGKGENDFFYYTESKYFGFSIGGRNRAITCTELLNQGKSPVFNFIDI